MHDALEDVCDRQLRAGDVPDCGGVPATVIVTIDLDDLINRGPARAKPLTGPRSRRGSCCNWANNADIIPAVLAASGAVLDLGQSRRIASRHQTLALIARDKGCSFPGLCSSAPILRTPPHPGMDRRRADKPQQPDFALRLPPPQLPDPRLDLPDEHRRHPGVDPAQMGRPRPETHDQHQNPSSTHCPETAADGTNRSSTELGVTGSSRSAGGSVPVRACRSVGLRSRPAVRQAAATRTRAVDP